MSFENELEAFHSYAEALPNNCIFLVDTYDTLQGVRHAIEVGKKLHERGYKLGGIRLDSGDLAWLSIEARKLLDAAGFNDTSILASNDLNERLIASLKQQGAKIDRWGVGTMLVTAYDQPALGGVYKLAALRKPNGQWDYKLKLSEQSAKSTTPGVLQVRRFRDGGQFTGDAIYDETRTLPEEVTIVDPADMTRRKTFPQHCAREDVLVPVLRAGKCIYDLPSLEKIRSRAQGQLKMLHHGVRRFDNPHSYPAGLELSLYEFKTDLILKTRRELNRSLRPSSNENR
jgi:nicotinate phosphoribosyltransferase